MSHVGRAMHSLSQGEVVLAVSRFIGRLKQTRTLTIIGKPVTLDMGRLILDPLDNISQTIHRVGEYQIPSVKGEPSVTMWGYGTSVGWMSWVARLYS
jgi:hypothetical protein